MSKPNVDRLPSTSHSCNGHGAGLSPWRKLAAPGVGTRGRHLGLGFGRRYSTLSRRALLLRAKEASRSECALTGHTRGLQRAERAGRATGPALALPARGRNLGAAEPAGSLALAGFDRHRPDGRDHQQEAGADPDRRPVEAAAVDDDDRHQVVRTSDSGSGR